MYYKRAIDVGRISRELGFFDVFVSAYNSSDRVKTVFREAAAGRKLWLVHPEYQYATLELPVGHTVVTPSAIGEIEQISSLLSAIGNLNGASLCIDITGFMRHAITYLLPKLSFIGIKNFTAIYSEPASYAKQEETLFSTTTSGVVRPVRGMYGTPSTGKDHLIMSIGYDHKLISEVSSYKDGVTTHPLFAFPSLSADMYQQSALRSEKSGDIVLKSDWVTNRLFAPASDPFATAAVISERVNRIDTRGPDQNVYLAPLSTKAQALGMGLYWLLEGKARGRCTVLLPECQTYSRETSVGLKRLWKYDIEL